MQTKDNIQDENSSLIQPKPSESQGDAKKIEWLKITVFVLIGFSSLVGVFYAGVSYARVKFYTNNQSASLITTPTNNKITENQVSNTSNTPQKTPETKSLGKTTISFTDVNGEIYLKSETDIIDTAIVKYGNSKMKTFTNVFSQDSPFVPVDRTELNPKDYKWTTLVTEPIYNSGDYKSISVSDIVSNFKQIPNTDNFLFVVELYRDASKEVEPSRSDELVKHENSLYMYDKNNVGQRVKKIMALDVLSKEEFPLPFLLIDSFSPEGRYVSIYLSDCVQCDFARVERLLLDLQSFATKNIGEVARFSWTGNGNYEYAEVVVTECKEPRQGPCYKDPETLPIKTGKM